MDFFEAQARARQRTSRLLFLFGLAVAGTIAAAYAAAIFILAVTDERPRGAPRWFEAAAPAVPLWQPGVFFTVAVGTLGVVGLASLYKWKQYSAGGSAVAESVGGRQVEPTTTDLRERRLLNVVEEMAIASGTPMPAVYILEEEAGINAFAAGLTTHDAVVAVTRGTLEKLNRDELQGVVGHEFSHILNGDMRLNLRIAAAIFGILVLGLAGRGILWTLRHVRVSSGRGKDNRGNFVIVLVAVGVALLIIGYVGYFFGRLIQAAVSRQREFLADASAVQFTRNPMGLTGALKKIGGYALGSRLQTNKSAAIGHFFFAQAFRSGFTGLWSTHPPLDERIRAIDPAFDGQMFVPPTLVDIEQESFAGAAATIAARRDATAGAVGAPPVLPAAAFAGTPPPPLAAETPSSFGGDTRPPPPRAPAGRALATATNAVRQIGALTPEQLADAQALLAATPERLRSAARSPEEAPALVFALLLHDDAAVRERQRAMIGGAGAANHGRRLEELEPWLASVRPEHRLPLLQLALPALQSLEGDALRQFVETLDELVHADAVVSPFEFALQKILTRGLALGHNPTSATVQFHSFQAVARDIAVVLSTLAHAATADPAFAAQAFAVGAAQLKLIESELHFAPIPAASLEALDAALDRLAASSLPIKQRTLVAAAHVVSADGQLLVTEAELLRAISAALDCPMPLLRG